MHRNIMDLTGQRFGRLTVIGVEYVQKRKHWRCSCDCGGSNTVQQAHLTSGICKSCGCLHAENSRTINLKHGLSKSPEHGIWEKMRGRCNNPNTPCFGNYGGRGIRVCSRWDDFSLFYADMGPRPSSKHTIERIDNDGDYTPDNCKWATMREQCANRRITAFLTHNGETLPLTEWARRLGINYRTIRSRMKYGWSTEEILQPILYDTHHNPVKSLLD